MEAFAALLAIALAVAAFVFWILMVVDCATKVPEAGSTKIVWILIVILLGILGAILYFVIQRPNNPPSGGRERARPRGRGSARRRRSSSTRRRVARPSPDVETAERQRPSSGFPS